MSSMIMLDISYTRIGSVLTNTRFIRMGSVLAIKAGYYIYLDGSVFANMAGHHIY